MKKKVNHFFWLAFLSFVVILPVSSFISTRILVLIFSFLLFFGERKFDLTEFLKSSWDVLLYLFVISIGLLYSSDKSMGIRTLETSFALLALPVICFRMPDVSRDRLNKIFLFFSFGIFSAGLICLIRAFFIYLNGGHNGEVFFFYDFTEIINSHPTYFAYYLIFAITYGLYALNYEKIQFPLPFIIGFILFCFLILLLTGGQTAL
jgi:hypothetical protein